MNRISPLLFAHALPNEVAVAYAGLERLELREARAALLLCAHGAQVEARDHHGHTAAAVARMAGASASLIDFLEGTNWQQRAEELMEVEE